MSTAALRKELASFKSKYSLAKPLKGKKGASTAGVSKAMSKGQKARKKRQEKKQREAEGYLDNTPYHKLTPVERRRLELRYADKLESNMAIIQRQARMAKKTADDVKEAQDKRERERERYVSLVISSLTPLLPMLIHTILDSRINGKGNGEERRSK
eukprot:TRINITY_DN1414_c0_g1_i7.p1 TRINITY_DN1414_c0_g1~~TRINITY_DN1414_c0_g1_i7.p1  ORF type:complete len:156 (-),score=14.32 TRINITY_DN1414_c0_g1_i7:199-666(-)